MIEAQIGRVLNRLRRLQADDSAATATEYAVMLALIIMVAIGAIQTFGGTLTRLFVTIDSSLFS